MRNCKKEKSQEEMKIAAFWSAGAAFALGPLGGLKCALPCFFQLFLAHFSGTHPATGAAPCGCETILLELTRGCKTAGNSIDRDSGEHHVRGCAASVRRLGNDLLALRRWRLSPRPDYVAIKKTLG